MDSSFWKGKKVLVTGHTGFKGSWLSLWLQNLKSEVVGISLDPPTNPSLFERAKVADGMISIREDIRNIDAVKSIFSEYRPEIVFHLAAQSLVRYSYLEPVETYATNVMGTLHVLEAIKQSRSVRAAVMVTSDKCYENREIDLGYKETDPLGGYDPYSSSKGCAEILIASYRNSYFSENDYHRHQTAVASVRAGNVIGGGDWAKDRLIPDIIRAFERPERVKIRNPNAVRPWQHVLEPLSGYIELAQKLYVEGIRWAEAWNFGPNEDDAKPVDWVADRMTKIWGENAAWYIDDADHPHEAKFLKLDCTKAQAKLGWKPRWDLNQALHKIIDWHKENSSGVQPRQLCEKQIAEYMNSTE